MPRIPASRLLALVVLSLTVLTGEGGAQTGYIYATLQLPGQPNGYVSASLKKGSEDNSAFFVVTDDVLRLANTNFTIEENPSDANGKTVSLRDATGRFLICCENDRVTINATPAEDTKWFRIRFYSAVQKDEIENRRRAMRQR